VVSLNALNTQFQTDLITKNSFHALKLNGTTYNQRPFEPKTSFAKERTQLASGRAWYKTWPLYLLTLLLAVALCIVSYLCFFSPVVTVLIVRHAEKGSTPPNDPALSTDGQARAQALVRVVGEANVRAIYATEFARTQQTVQPLATQLGLTITQISASDTDGLVNDILSNHRGEVVFVAGHSNTVPVIIEKLNGGQIPPINETEFDKLFVVTVYRLRRAKVVQLRYGNPT
jgi:2,3-bisphosphoglycerate-dependent phosphoglycerate mutase